MRRSVLPAVFLAVLLAGCSLPARSRAVEELLPVETLGFDVTDDGVIVSASAGGTKTGDKSAALAASGGSFPQAVERLRSWSDAQELFFGHVRYVVAGEPAARAGLTPVLDVFARSSQTSLELPLIVVRGGEARPLVTGRADPAYEISALLDAMRRDVELSGAARCFTLRQVIQRLNRSGAALCCAIRAKDAGENVPSAEDGTFSVLCAGYAVLRRGALAGFLDRDAALGADLLLGLAGQAEYLLPGQSGPVTVSLLESAADISPRQTRGGTPVLAVTVRVRAGIQAADGADVSRREARQALSAALARSVAAQVEAALSAERELGADFLELRRLLQSKAPETLAALPEEEFLRTLRWQIFPQAILERSYDTDGGVVHG